MDTIILIMVSFVILATIIIVTVLVLLTKGKNNQYKKQLENLEIEKNKLDSVPIIPELTKVESYLNNEKLESMYNNWKDRLDVIRTNQIPKITDMLLEADYSLSQKDYKATIYKIAKLEMEIYKVRTNSDFLLKEIKEITSSEERSRTLITKLKTEYRDLYEKYNKDRESYGELAEPVELQFETIAKRFEDFEAVMESNEFLEVNDLIKAIDEMIKHMSNVVEELPSIILMCKTILPKKIEEVQNEYNRMVKEGYPLDYLNIEYNIDEANKTVRIKDPKASIDVGAVGKGYATEQAAKVLEQKGCKSYVLNIGGNIRIVGTKSNGDGWTTGIKDPNNPYGGYVMYLKIADTSCVTSGVYERYFMVNGVRYHHIIDEKTLMPANYFISLTVITKDSGLADALSTALFCMTYEEGLALVNTLENVDVLWIYSDGTQKYTKGIVPIDPNKNK